MLNILFLHGWGGNADSFAPISQYLARITDSNGTSYRILTPTLPCPPAAVYTLEDYADDVDAYLQANGVARCVVVAHSFGARLVAVLYVRHPQLFTKIVITGGAGLPVRRGWVRLKTGWYKFWRRLGVPMKGGSADYRCLDANGKKTFQNIVNRDLSTEFSQITAPVLLIWGARDKATPLSLCRRLARLIPHAQQRIYRHGGHFAYLEDAARFVRDVRNFIEGGQDASAVK